MSWRSASRTAFASVALASIGLAQAPSQDSSTDDLRRQIEELRREVAELKKGQARSEALEREVATFANRLQDPEVQGNVSAPNSKSLTFGGSYRVRAHYVRDRNFSLGGGNDDDYITHRLRLNIGAELDDHTRLFAQLRSAYLWGSTGGNLGPEAANGDLTLHQGFAEFEDVMASGWDLRLGRQEFDYGEGRLLSRNDWEEFGRAWDGAKLSSQFDTVNVDFLWAKAADGFFGFPGTTSSIDVDLYGLYVSLEPNDGFTADFYVLPLENRATESTFVHAGARARIELDVVDLGGEIAGVRDRGDGDTPHVTYSEAYFVAADAGISLGDDENAPRLSLGYTRGSNEYIPLVPDLHRFAGTMDIINPFVNLIDYEAALSLPVAEEWTLTGAYHAFQHASKPSGGDGKTIGYELDVALAGVCTDFLRVELGYGHFFPRQGFDEYTPGTSLAFNPWAAAVPSNPNDVDFAYLQFDIPF